MKFKLIFFYQKIFKSPLTLNYNVMVVKGIYMSLKQRFTNSEILVIDLLMFWLGKLFKDNTAVKCFFSLSEERTTHTVTPVFVIHFESIISKKAGVSSVLPTKDSGYFPILTNLAASS